MRLSDSLAKAYSTYTAFPLFWGIRISGSGKDALFFSFPQAPFSVVTALLGKASGDPVLETSKDSIQFMVKLESFGR